VTVTFPFSNDFRVGYRRTLRIEEEYWEFPTGEDYEYEDVVVVEDAFMFWGFEEFQNFLLVVREIWMLEEDYPKWLNSNQDEESTILLPPDWIFFPSISLKEDSEKLNLLRDFVRSNWMETTPWVFNISIDDELFPHPGIPALKPTPTNWKAILEELKQQIRQKYLDGDFFTLNNPRGF